MFFVPPSEPFFGQKVARRIHGFGWLGQHESWKGYLRAHYLYKSIEKWWLLIIELLAHADMHTAHGQIVSKPSKLLVRNEEDAIFVGMLFFQCFFDGKNQRDGPFV